MFPLDSPRNAVAGDADFGIGRQGGARRAAFVA